VSNCEHWAVLWRSENKLDGKREHLLHKDCMPLLFRTRNAAREHIKLYYGNIKNRPDLRAEPHGWKMPAAVKVKIEVKR
jgi:hypothetical protein